MNEIALMLLGGLIAKALGEKGLPSDADVVETLRSLKPILSKRIEINTATVRNNEKYDDAGYLMYVQNPEDASLPVYVRLNEPDSELIDITKNRLITAPFYRFFVTNAAGVGTLILIISKSPAFSIVEAVANTKLVSSNIMVPVDIQAQYLTLDANAKQWGGTALTARNISLDLAKLDVALSTRASQTTLASLLAQHNITLSALRDGIIAGLVDPVISQPTPEDLKHVPHGWHAGSSTYKPLAVDVDGVLQTSGGGGVVSLTFVIDGGGVVITTGEKGHLEIPFDCTITGWTLIADQSGSIVIDVWKTTYASAPPAVGNTITGTEKPTLAAAQKNQDLTLTTWTTAVTAGDILAFNVDSVATVERVTLSIRATKS